MTSCRTVALGLNKFGWGTVDGPPPKFLRPCRDRATVLQLMYEIKFIICIIVLHLIQ